MVPRLRVLSRILLLYGCCLRVSIGRLVGIDFNPEEGGHNEDLSVLDTVYSSHGSNLVSLNSPKRKKKPLFEGDIIPTYDEIRDDYGPKTLKELQKDGILPRFQKSGNINKMNVNSALLDHAWENRVDDVILIPYKFKENHFSAEEKEKITVWVKHLARAIGVIKFVTRTTEKNYIHVVKDDGCWSNIGNAKEGGQELSLGEGCIYRDTVQHELIHALGFYHEQSRSDRDEYIKIHYNNIKDDEKHNFEKRDDADNLGTPYDYASTMHYTKTAWSKNGEDTITAVGGHKFGFEKASSVLDIENIRLVFQCKSGPRNFAEYKATMCSDDCPCWENAKGCSGNETCQGSLICKENKCQYADGENHGGGEMPWLHDGDNTDGDGDDGEGDDDDDGDDDDGDDDDDGEKDCVDDSNDCDYWAKSGECNINPDYMLAHCTLSCEVCEL